MFLKAYSSLMAAERSTSSGRLLQANERRALGAGSVVGSFTSRFAYTTHILGLPLNVRPQTFTLRKDFCQRQRELQTFGLCCTAGRLKRDRSKRMVQVEAAEAEISYISHNATQLHLSLDPHFLLVCIFHTHALCLSSPPANI